MEKEKKKAKITQQTDGADHSEVERVEGAGEKVEILKNDLEKANQQAAENFEGWQRERADFLNYKKRIERDRVST